MVATAAGPRPTSSKSTKSSSVRHTALSHGTIRPTTKTGNGLENLIKNRPTTGRVGAKNDCDSHHASHQELYRPCGERVDYGQDEFEMVVDRMDDMGSHLVANQTIEASCSQEQIFIPNVADSSLVSSGGN